MTKSRKRSIKVSHDVSIIHRDLKPENILIFDEDNPVLIDFDQSINFGYHILSLTSNVTRIIGTVKYIDPFCRRNKQSRKYLSCKSDIYALGVIIGELLLDPKFDPAAISKSIKKFKKRYEILFIKTLKRDVPLNKFYNIRALKGYRVNGEFDTRESSLFCSDDERAHVMCDECSELHK